MTARVRGPRPGPLAPRARAQDRLTLWATAILCLLASLALAGAVQASRAAATWTRDLEGEATVLVRPGLGETADAAAARAAEALAGVPGVEQAAALEPEKAMALLEPWLGADADLGDLPVPRLVTVELDRAAPATAEGLKRALAAAGVSGQVDDHSAWTADIRRAAGMAAVILAFIAALIVGCAAAIIGLAARAALAADQAFLEVLHVSGADDSFIAGLFQARFAKVGAVSGAVGGAAALLLFGAARLAGRSDGLAPHAAFGLGEMAVAGGAPLVAAVVAALAARIAALKAVRAMP